MRHCRRFGVALLAAGMAALAVAPAATALSASVRTGGGMLVVRAGPGTGFQGYSSVDDGSSTEIVCQHAGVQVDGPGGSSILWDQLTSGGWVSDAYVYTGSSSQVASTCPYAPDPLRPNARGVDDAISWEYQRLGSRSDEGWCLRFQAQAFGWTYAGFATAQDQYQWLKSHGQISAGVPPRGALTWYSTPDGAGHITVSVGAGRVIGTSVHGSVGVASYTYMGGYEGWSPPYFANGGWRPGADHARRRPGNLLSR